MSNFACPVVRIEGFGKHKNADTLCVTQVEGSTCIFKEGAFQVGDMAVFVPVDAVVPLDHPAFAWLKKPGSNRTHHRVKALKLRGVFSDGFLVTLSDLQASGQDVAVLFQRGPDGTGIFRVGEEHGGTVYQLGQDLSEVLGITKYIEIEPTHMNTASEADPGYMPAYDMEAWKKYKHLLQDGEEVVVTEKCHGANSRFCYVDNRLWVASHHNYKAQDESNLWWKVAAQYGLAAKLELAPGMGLYGEAYGSVQDLKYGVPRGEYRFVAFDVYDIALRKFLDYDDFVKFCDFLQIPHAPELYRGPYSPEALESVVNPPGIDDPGLISALGPCIREGAVIRPVIERWNEETHRTVLKHVSRAYLLRKNGSELK